MSQYQKLQEKLRRQSEILFKKIKNPKKSREITNAEVQLQLVQYRDIQVHSNEYFDKVDILHDGLSKLTFDEMTIVKNKFWECMTNTEIGMNFGKTEGWVRSEIKRITEKLKKELS